MFRAIRDALPNDPAAQERILGASLTALAIADVCFFSHGLFDLAGKLMFIIPHTGYPVCTALFVLINI